MLHVSNIVSIRSILNLCISEIFRFESNYFEASAKLVSDFKTFSK